MEKKKPTTRKGEILFHLLAETHCSLIWPSPFLYRLASSAFPDIGSVGRVEQKKTKKKRRPGTPVSLLWSPEKTRHEPKINTAEKLVDVFVKLRQCREKDQPPKLYVVTMPIFMIKRTI